MAWAFVRQGGGSAAKAAATTAVATVPAGGHAVGNQVVAVVYSSGSATPTIADTGGNTWVDLDHWNTGGSGRYEVFISTLTTALQAGDTITGSFASATRSSITTMEFSGGSTTIDKVGVGGNGTSTAVFSSAGGETSNFADSLIIGSLLGSNRPSGDTVTAADTDSAGGDTWHVLTRRGTTGGSATTNHYMETSYKIPTSAVSQKWDFTVSNSVAFFGLLTAIKAAPVGTTFTQALTGNATSTASIQNQIGKKLTGTASSVASIAKQISKALRGNGTSTASITKQIGKLLRGDATSAASIVASKVKPVVMAATASVSASITKLVGKVLRGDSTSSASITKLVGKGLRGDSASSASLTKQIGKPMRGDATSSASMLRQIGKVLRGDSASSASITKLVGKALRGDATASASIKKQIGKPLRADATGSGSITKRVGKPLRADATVGAAMTRVIGKSLRGDVSASASITKQVGKGLVANVSSVAELVAEAFVTIFFPEEQPSLLPLDPGTTSLRLAPRAGLMTLGVGASALIIQRVTNALGVADFPGILTLDANGDLSLNLDALQGSLTLDG